ncbi:MAG TPA: cytochrome c-type biogenesis protein CcmH [Oligoflexia bacterium]|nr:cytochrome c-type biogenesis protein CcmH [Oligoflexia bacterium]HMP26775.1 cytochrome c-type biogenesis protein CcmH [Oligoflexia bacterium]
MNIPLKLFLFSVFLSISFGEISLLFADAQRDFFEITTNTLSPFCPGVSLRDCQSSKAIELKEQIKSDLASGKTKAKVLEDLFARYGEELRALPKFGGIGLFAWLAPLVFLFVGVAVLVFFLKKSVK